MPQTTSGMSAANMKVEYSLNGSSYTDIGGFASAVEPDGGDRKVGEGYTFVGDTPLLVKGKRESMSLKVKAVYTEGAGDIQEIVRAAYEGASDFWLRWSPQGGTTGQFQYTAKGIITSAPYPTGDAESEDPIFLEFEVKATSVTKSVAA
jgi:hypothetical protein